MAESSTSSIDQSHPWPGLEAFRENDSSHFFGRDTEIQELLDRVERQTLTVLFSQSGLGKTSLLRAGLFPALRRIQLLPFYLRLDHSEESADLTIQVWEALHRHLVLDPPYNNETGWKALSLWEWFHDMRDGLLSERLSGVLPVLVFDQFEEIFTLGAGSGRAGSRLHFLTQLADLIENRPPDSLEHRLDSGECDQETYSFDTTSYRILLSLRDDYLSQLEQERDLIPSLMQNRMSIGRLKGKQAMTVVTNPGAGLVDDDVAEKIVRFVGDENDLPLTEFDLEPPLLSLVCRELNRERIKGGKDKISADLLHGSHAGILEHYYQDCFEGLGPEAKRFVEDELVTDSGHRESMTVERARCAIGNDAIRRLIDTRLLHTFQRESLPRIELTHDVLTGVVSSSRDKRREVEAKEEAVRERQIARKREKQARHARRRSAAIAAIMAVLAISTLVMSYVAGQKLREAEHARDVAGFMLEMFRGDYKRIGKLERYEKIARDARIYVPARGGSTETDADDLNRLVRQGNFAQVAGDFEAAETYYARAAELAEAAAEKAGDKANPAELAGKYERLVGVLVHRNKLDSARIFQNKALTLRRKLTDKEMPDPWRTLLANDLASTCAELGALEFLAGDFGESIGRYHEVIAIRSGLVDAHPGVPAFRAGLGLAHYDLAGVLAARGDFEKAIGGYRRAAALLAEASKQSPLDFFLQADLAASYKGWGRVHAESGDLDSAVERLKQAVLLWQEVSGAEPFNTHFTHQLATSYCALGDVRRRCGELEEADTLYSQGIPILASLLSLPSSNSVVRKDLADSHSGYGRVFDESGQREKAGPEHQEAIRMIEEVASSEPASSIVQRQRARIYQASGAHFLRQRKFKQAADAYTTALEARRSVVDTHPENNLWQDELADSHRTLGDVSREQGDDKGAQQHFKQSLAILEALTSKDPDNPVWVNHLERIRAALGLDRQ